MPRLPLACLAALVVGCGGPAPAPRPNDVAWTPPPDWTTVASSDGAFQLTLPPWLMAFDNSGAIFASEPPPEPGAEIPMQLMAQGPDPHALDGFGATLEGWVHRRVSGPAQGSTNPGEGVPTITRLVLPIGPGIRYDRIDRPGTRLAWRIVAFAFETPDGVAYLQLDGPPAAWPARAADLERVVRLFRVRSSSP